MSTTWSVKLNVPASVGRPASTPAGDSVSPFGSVPALTENVRGVTVAGAASVAE